VPAPFVAVQQAIRHIERGGRIVNLASNAALRVGNPMASVYALTKSAVTGMTRGLAHDLGPRGITVNAVLPGPTATDMVPNEGPVADYLRSTIPLGRLADPSEIASLVAYLVSGEASFVHGTSLTVDGGATA
jgi:3-oxoacyl-[acyl-carrier protein] reductase